jgi:hypothetical protein
MYGLAAGVISYASSLSYDDRYLGWLALSMNYPAFLLMFSLSFGHPLWIIAISTAVWSLIGLIIYALVKMLRLGP